MQTGEQTAWVVLSGHEWQIQPAHVRSGPLIWPRPADSTSFSAPLIGHSRHVMCHSLKNGLHHNDPFSSLCWLTTGPSCQSTILESMPHDMTCHEGVLTRPSTYTLTFLSTSDTTSLWNFNNNKKKLSYCCDSRSYCVVRRPLSGTAVVLMTVSNWNLLLISVIVFSDRWVWVSCQLFRCVLCLKKWIGSTPLGTRRLQKPICQ